MDWNRLRRLDQLARAASISGNDSQTALARDFLAYAQLCPTKLTVVEPKLYTLTGDKKQHAIDACTALGNCPIGPSPIAADILGMFTENEPIDAIVSFSPDQIQASVLSSTKNHILPLLREVYTQGAELVRDFTVNEALVGLVSYSRGALSLDQIPKLTERFIAGPYLMQTVMDTPANSVHRYLELVKYLHDVKASPMGHLLNNKELNVMLESAKSLRTKLGSLSRYKKEVHRTFQVETNSVFVRSNGYDYFYLYAQKTNKNILVYFGESPFQNPNRIPQDFIVIDGKEGPKTLASLLEHGIYEPSRIIANQRLVDLKHIESDVLHREGSAFAVDHPAFSLLLQNLQNAVGHFDLNESLEARTSYLLTKSPTFLEFAICPAQQDPVLEQLLMRLSWNETISQYHDTRHFLSQSAQLATEEVAKKAIAIQQNMVFANQQNLDVNFYLYRNHQSACLKAGVVFDVKKS